MKADVVIGANWGDEGKAMATDFLSTPDTIVVRYNGGSQVSHTVSINGNRHVFHHIGSGTFQGASTFLSKFFIHNPEFFFQELDELENKFSISPKVFVDPRGIVTTPFDMMINHIAEESRGTNRHGSCGLGINETIKRNEAFYGLTVGQLQSLSYSDLKSLLIEIRNIWVPTRLDKLELGLTDQWKTRLHSENMLEHFLNSLMAYPEKVEITGPDILCKKHIVFEGAQGLLLDEDHYWFPHVTHSHTGLKNVVSVAREIDATELNVHYVTRAYATRHGNGPFPHEVIGLSYEDKTNVPNTWQGTLRFGYLDLDLLSESIENDLKHKCRMKINASLVVTCLDQIQDGTTVIAHGREEFVTPDSLLKLISERVKLPVSVVGYGPDRNNYRRV